MSDKPTYLKLLNAVSVAETAAYEYLTAWADVTPHDGVRQVLRTVAAREGEHGLAFAKRINELGYDLRKGEPDPKQAERLSVACSDKSDFEKMQYFGLGKAAESDGPDVFDRFFADKSIDPTTGALLGRYVCEERDSGRLLRACYEQVCAENGMATAAPTTDADVARVEGKVDALCRAVDELRQIVVAQSMPQSKKIKVS